MKNIKQKIINHKKAIFILAPFLLLIIILILLNSNIIRKLKGSAYKDAGFEDENFYSCVVNSYNNQTTGNSYDVSEILPDEAYSEITKLNCTSNGISDLGGIQNKEFSNLSDLYLANNQLTNVDVLSSLTNLQKLNLGTNQLTNVDVLSNLTNLQMLDLSSNQLTNVDVLSSLTNLQMLDLSSNQLTNVDVLSSLTNLQYLSLNSNQLTNVDSLSNLTNLQELDLVNNQLTNVDSLSSLVNLKQLWLSYNNLTNVDSLFDLTELRNLDLNDNQITNIDHITHLSNLHTLNLGNNQISDISQISYITNLTSLDLSGNSITNSDLDHINILIGLESLNLGRNNLTNADSLSNLTNLRDLNLSDNQLTNVEFISYLTKLKSLDLRGNNIASINIINNPNLSTLHIDKETIYVLKDKETALPQTKIISNENKSYDGNFQFVGENKDKIIASESDWLYVYIGYINISYYISVYDVTSDKYIIDLDNKKIDCKEHVLKLENIRLNNDNLYAEVIDDNFIIKENETNEIVDTFQIINVGEPVDEAYYQAGFEDENLYQCVVDEYNENYSNGNTYEYDELLSESKLSQITSLSCPNRSIKSSGGLYKLSNLNTLDLHNNVELSTNYNVLTYVNISGNNKLKNINLSNNIINMIDGLDNNTELLEFRMSNNQLKNINVSSNKDLRSLDLSGNKLSNIDLSNNEELIELNLSNNKFRNIDVTNNSKLTKLLINENGLSTINVDNNNELEELSASYNNLKEVIIGGNENLSKLKLSNNNMTKLILNNLPSLEELYLSDNSLKNFSDYNLNALKILDLHNNIISTINLERLPNLQFILLWGNPANDTEKHYILKGESTTIEPKVIDENRRKSYYTTKSGVINLRDYNVTALKVGNVEIKESFFDLLTYQDLLKEPFKYCSKVFELSKISSNDYYEECDSLIKQINDEIAFTNYKSTYEIHVYDLKSDKYIIDKKSKIIDLKGNSLNASGIEVKGDNLVGMIRNNTFVIKDGDYIVDTYRLVNYKTNNNNKSNSSGITELLDDIENMANIALNNGISNYNRSYANRITYSVGTKTNDNNSNSNYVEESSLNYSTDNLKDTVENYTEVNPQYKKTTSTEQKSNIIYVIIILIMALIIGILLGKNKKQQDL